MSQFPVVTTKLPGWGAPLPDVEQRMSLPNVGMIPTRKEVDQLTAAVESAGWLSWSELAYIKLVMQRIAAVETLSESEFTLANLVELPWQS